MSYDREGYRNKYLAFKEDINEVCAEGLNEEDNLILREYQEIKKMNQQELNESFAQFFMENKPSKTFLEHFSLSGSTTVNYGLLIAICAFSVVLIKFICSCFSPKAKINEETQKVRLNKEIEELYEKKK